MPWCYFKDQNYRAWHTVCSINVGFVTIYGWRSGTKHRNGSKAAHWHWLQRTQIHKEERFWHTLACPASFCCLQPFLLRYKVTDRSCGILKGCLIVVLTENQTANCLLLFGLGFIFGWGGKRQGMSKKGCIASRIKVLSTSAWCQGLKKREGSHRTFWNSLVCGFLTPDPRLPGEWLQCCSQAPRWVTGS